MVLPVEKRLEYYEALDLAHTKDEFEPFLNQMVMMVEEPFKPYWHALGLKP